MNTVDLANQKIVIFAPANGGEVELFDTVDTLRKSLEISLSYSKVEGSVITEPTEAIYIDEAEVCLQQGSGIKHIGYYVLRYITIKPDHI